MLTIQNKILEMVATGRPLLETLNRLCLLIEERFPGLVCSVLEIDQSSRLQPAAGPSLPASYSQALSGLAIGPYTGSCGTAAYSGRKVVVEDVATDIKWADFKHLVLPLGLKACWSFPVSIASGEIVGTFAFYCREQRGPTQSEEETIAACVHLCAIAIERDQRVKERERKALTDDLTGLGNRAAFDESVRALVRDQAAWSLVVFDLDNLKVTNDTFGHLAGDDLIRSCASRLKEAAAPSSVFRIGGDEFAAIVEGDGLEQMRGFSAAMLDVVRKPARCGQHMVSPSMTAGGAMHNLGEDIDRVRQNADMALYHAKETCRGRFLDYSPHLRSRMARRDSLIRSVTAALAEKRLETHYQPVCDLASGRIVGSEALCRLRTEQGVLLGAEHFIEATKDASVSFALTERMISNVVSDTKRWSDREIEPPYIAINLSPSDFQGEDISRVLKREVDHRQIDPRRIVIEITEATYLGAETTAVFNQIHALKNLGFRLALDDFGTGFASLSHLISLPIDFIKIDRSFTKKLTSRGAPTAVVGGLVAISSQLGIDVIAEGIETEEQRALLLDLGCKLGQGYLLGRPTSADRLTEKMREVGVLEDRALAGIRAA